MCHWNTVNWNCIIRKETLEEKLSEEEKHALSRLQKELSEQKKVELLFTDADLEKDITFFLSGHHVKPEECMLLATEPEEVAWAKKDADSDSDSDQLTIIGYEVPDFSKQMPLSNVDMLLLGLEEVDTEFLLRTFQRKHHLPWRILETKRCYLREITLDDMDDLFDLYNKKGISDYIEPLYERQEEEEYQRAYIENMYGYYGYGMWLVKGKDTHQLIGRAGIDYRKLLDEEIIEMGYVIAPEYQRQGYAYEVCQAIMAWVKNNLEFRRIDCLVEPGNEASLGLLHKLGFQETEKIKQDGKIFRHFWYFYP